MAITITTSVARVTDAANANTITSGSFTPAVGELLIACVEIDQTTTTAPTISDTASGTWTQRAFSNSGNDAGFNGGSYIYSRNLITTSASMTVTAALTTFMISLKVYRVTAAGAIVFGATGHGSSTTQNATLTAFTSTVGGSTLIADFLNFTATVNATSSDLTVDSTLPATDNVTFGSGFKQPLSQNPGTSITFNINSNAASPQWHWSALELIEATVPVSVVRRAARMMPRRTSARRAAAPVPRQANPVRLPDAIRSRWRSVIRDRGRRSMVVPAQVNPPRLPDRVIPRWRRVVRSRGRTFVPRIARPLPPFLSVRPRIFPRITREAKNFTPVRLVMPTLPSLYGLGFWVRADTIAGIAPGAVVASWTDESTNALTVTNATGGTQPSYIQGAMNGLPVVRFNGGHFLANASSYTANPSWTCFTVASQTAAANAWIFQNGNTNGFALGTNAGSTNRELLLRGQADVVGSAYVLGAPEIKMGMRDGNTLTSTLFANGVLDATSTANYSTASGGMTVGSFEGGTGGFWTGDIAEIVAYDRTLSNYEIQLVLTYLSTKWLVSSAVPGPEPMQPASMRPRRVRFLWRDRTSAVPLAQASAPTNPDRSWPLSAVRRIIRAPRRDRTAGIPLGQAAPAATPDRSWPLASLRRVIRATRRDRTAEPPIVQATGPANPAYPAPLATVRRYIRTARRDRTVNAVPLQDRLVPVWRPQRALRRLVRVIGRRGRHVAPTAPQAIPPARPGPVRHPAEVTARRRISSGPPIPQAAPVPVTPVKRRRLARLRNRLGRAIPRTGTVATNADSGVATTAGPSATGTVTGPDASGTTGGGEISGTVS